MKIGITGANGFVGRATLAAVRQAGHDVAAMLRRPDAMAGADFEVRAIDAIGPNTDWGGRLAGLDAVIHLAARVHVMTDRAADPLAEFRAVNRAGTLRLAEAAAAAGVKRFVFASSIKVNGEATPWSPAGGGHPFRADDPAAPQDPYGISKWEAEQALAALAAQGVIEVVVVRPPLVYGRGAGGNIARLAGLVRRGIPLPLASIENRRSLVAVETLADLIVRLANDAAAAGCTFLVSDGEDLSTPELIGRIGLAMGRPARLLPFPVAALRAAGRMSGRRGEIDRLTGSLQVDMADTATRLGWTPPLSVDEALRRAFGPDQSRP